jgi:hypothetical protein
MPGNTRRTRRWRTALPAVSAALLLTTACADLQQPEVERVATAFGQAVADPAQRCALLAPTTVAALEADDAATCTTAMAELDLPGGSVESTAVWGDNAQVHLSGDTLFLTVTEQGWKVTAAGCQAQGEAPYRCRVEA